MSQKIPCFRQAARAIGPIGRATVAEQHVAAARERAACPREGDDWKEGAVPNTVHCRRRARAWVLLPTQQPSAAKLSSRRCKQSDINASSLHRDGHRRGRDEFTGFLTSARRKTSRGLRLSPVNGTHCLRKQVELHQPFESKVFEVWCGWYTTGTLSPACDRPGPSAIRVNSTGVSATLGWSLVATRSARRQLAIRIHGRERLNATTNNLECRKSRERRGSLDAVRSHRRVSASCGPIAPRERGGHGICARSWISKRR